MKSKVITILLIAIFSSLLWVFISLSDEYFMTIDLPVRFKDLPGNMAVANQSSETTSISLKGGGWQLAQIYYGRSPEFAVSPRYEIGRHKLNLRNYIDNNPWLTSTLQITELVPEQIEYLVDDVIEKKVFVVPDVNLSYKDGYGLVGKVKLVDDTVTVRGAKSIIENLKTLSTIHYEFTNLEKGVNSKLKIKGGPGIILSHTDCSIEFDIQKIVDKSFEHVDVQVRDVPGRRELLLFPNSITVVLRGGINTLGRLEDDAVNAHVSFNQAIMDTTGHLVPVVEIPANTSIVDLKPKSLGYIIKQY